MGRVLALQHKHTDMTSPVRQVEVAVIPTTMSCRHCKPLTPSSATTREIH